MSDTPFPIDHYDAGTLFVVSAGGTELATYVYRPDSPQLESPKPYLHPIRTRAGDLVSLFRPHDHVWHKGIAWSLPYVGEHNFWGGPTYVHGRSYVQLENNGSATHRRMTELSAEDDMVRIGHELDWTSQQGAPVISEERSLTASLPAGHAWELVFGTRMTNVSGATLTFASPTTKGRENAGYGGLFWRGPRSFTGGTVVSPDGSGADDLRGKRAEWFAFRGRHDVTDTVSTVVMVDDSANPQHPAPFFSEELDLPDGRSLAFRYAVVIADGDGDPRTLADLGRAAL